MTVVRLMLAVLAGAPLWAAGTVFFDAVHWVLHVFLGSRWQLLRALAWPHSVHHQWLDSKLRIVWQKQRANVWCHLVPEYLTQLAFSAGLLLMLPAASVASCALIQTGVFWLILRERGLDINHRAIEMLDAYRPGWVAPPQYHALHHVWPDSHFSAYSRLVDWLVGGGLHLRGRRIALAGAESPLGRALEPLLEREAPASLQHLEAPAAASLADIDLLVLCDPELDAVDWIETFIARTRARQLPPEVWAIHPPSARATARFYYRDVRVIFRAIAAAGSERNGYAQARSAARWALFFARRGLCWIPARPGIGALREFRRFRGCTPERPARARSVRHRSELLAA
jgi:hypothetical protein